MNLKLLLVILIVIGILSRLIPHAPNIAALSALMLFSGTYLPKKYLWIPFLTLIVSDLIIGFYGTDMIWVYGSYLIVGLLGFWLRNHKKATNIIFISFLSSMLFFLITNFGVWAPPNKWYTHNLSGLLQSYTLALPFFRNSLVGDMSYTLLLFGGYELIQKLAKRYLPEKVTSILI